MHKYFGFHHYDSNTLPEKIKKFEPEIGKRVRKFKPKIDKN